MERAARVVLCLSDCQPPAGTGGGGLACQELCDFGPDLPDLSGSVAAGVPSLLSVADPLERRAWRSWGLELTMLPTPRDFIVNLLFGLCFHRVGTAKRSVGRLRGLCCFKLLKFLGL